MCSFVFALSACLLSTAGSNCDSAHLPVTWSSATLQKPAAFVHFSPSCCHDQFVTCFSSIFCLMSVSMPLSGNSPALPLKQTKPEHSGHLDHQPAPTTLTSWPSLTAPLRKKALSHLPPDFISASRSTLVYVTEQWGHMDPALGHVWQVIFSKGNLLGQHNTPNISRIFGVLWSQDRSPLLATFAAFTDKMRKVFYHPVQG